MLACVLSTNLTSIPLLGAETVKADLNVRDLNGDGQQNMLDVMEYYKKEIIAVCRHTGIFPSVLMGQAIHEGGINGSSLVTEANNWFGIKYFDQLGERFGAKPYSCPTFEFYGGVRSNITAEFAHFKNPGSGLLAYSELFWNGLYDNTVKKEIYDLENATWESMAWAVHQSPYATDPNYYSKLKDCIEVFNLTKWDKLAFPDGRKRAGAPDGSEVKEIGEYPDDGYNMKDVDLEAPKSLSGVGEEPDVGDPNFSGWDKAINIDFASGMLTTKWADSYPILKGIEESQGYIGGVFSGANLVKGAGKNYEIVLGGYKMITQKQYDYGSDMGSNGCGPTSMAILVSNFTNSSVDARNIYDSFVSRGYTSGLGTDNTAIINQMNDWGYKTYATGSIKELERALRSGKTAILHVGGYDHFGRIGGHLPPWQGHDCGHYCVAIGIKGNKVLVCDPGWSDADNEIDLNYIDQRAKNFYIVTPPKGWKLKKA